MSGDSNILTLNLPLVAVTSPSIALIHSSTIQASFTGSSLPFWTMESQQDFTRMGI